jgi:hypothetical protein
VRLWLLVLVVLPAAFLAVSARLYAWPDEDAPRRVDVVLVLAGDFEDRLPVGRELVERGVARELALSEEPDPDYPRRLCRRPRVSCFQADPYSTIGEAATFRSVAARHGWRSVLVVTSVYHVTRARMLFRRCLDGPVYATGADEGALGLAHGAFWEWPKLVYSLTVRRGC